MTSGGAVVVSAFFQSLCRRVQAAATSRHTRSRIRVELGRLLEALLLIRIPVVEAAEEKLSNSKAVRGWLRDLKETAYDADDLLDELPLRAPEAEVEVDDDDMEDAIQPRCLFLSCASSIPAPNGSGCAIKAIRDRILKLARKQPSCLPLQSMSHRIESIATTLVEPGVLYRDDDRSKMIQLLTSEASAQVNLSLIAIIGRGGIGKTAFARLLFDDEVVAGYFELKVWVTATEICDTGSLLRTITESAVGYPMECRDMNQILDSLEKSLLEKRFLLILDDVCHGKFDWESLQRKHLQAGLNGSKVVITTTMEEIVNSITIPSKSYYLNRLSDEDCSSLFKRYACLDRVSNNFIEGLEAISVKLEGLPLAARMVGSLLCSNFERNDWKVVLDAGVWKTKSDEYGLLSALWLSYQHLPPHIKECLVYCSLFPKDHKLEKDRLIRMWMAQGLIQPHHGARIEDLGSAYFDFLLHRSFFQISEGRHRTTYTLRDLLLSKGEDLDSSISGVPARYLGCWLGSDPFVKENSEDKYIMHGLVHDLVVAITLHESSSLRLAETGQSSKTLEMANHHSRKKKLHHLSLQLDVSASFGVIDSCMLDRLRTLLVFRTMASSFDYDALFMKLRCIRVMCFSDKSLEELPNSISNLKQLRYLDLSGTSINTMPEGLCSLCNLQTLYLSASSTSLQELPRGMNNLINLRHLKGNRYQISRIYGIGKLTSLQELEEFTVQCEDGHKLAELKDMAQLRGELLISQLEHVHSEEEAKETKLNEKKIKKLELQWSWDYAWDGNPRKTDDGVLEGLRPHSNLKELTIKNHGGANIPSWFQDSSLSELETLQILDCRNWDLPLLGQLQLLKFLNMHGSHKLRQVGAVDAQVFPLLQVLHMHDLPGLQWFTPLPPTLVELWLHMVGLLVLPALQPSENSSTSYSSLSSLHISVCHRLTTLQVGLLQHENQQRLKELKSLNFQNCAGLVYLPDHGFSALVSLKFLHIESCPKLTCSLENGAALPSSLVDLKIIKCPGLINDSFFMCLERLHSLSSMLIKGELAVEDDRPPTHPPLTSLPGELLQHLTALRELEIANCEWLVSLGFQALGSLKSLKIAGCPKLAACSSPVDKSSLLLEYLEIEESSLQMLSAELLQSFTFLQELQIVKCHELVSFSDEVEEGLQCVTSLKRLHLHGCQKLLSLPSGLRSIPSLEELYITECSAIQSMPDKGLPPSLQILVINHCRFLRRRCKRGGDDWPKIAHVYYVLIDDKSVGTETLSESSSSEYISISTLSDFDYP